MAGSPSASVGRGRLAHALASLAAFFIVAIVYLVTATPHLVGADNGEFVTLAFSQGVAHPPGYPLYTAYLRAMNWLPAVTPAHSTALATALLGAASIGVLVRALQAWRFPTMAAIGAAFVFALDRQVWDVHTHAEVFALNNLIAAGILWAAAPDCPRRGLSRAATLGLLAGLGLSNQHTIVLLAPIGLYGTWLALTESSSRSVALAAAVTAGFIGLLPYLYVLWSASDCVHCLQWRNPDTVAELWQVFTRADYGTTSLGSKGDPMPVENLLAFARHLVVGTFGATAVAAAVGVATWRRQERSVTHLAVLGATFLLAGPLFAMLFNYEPVGIGAEIVARFYPLPMLLLAPFVAAGLSLGPSRLAVAAGVAVAAIGGMTGVVGRHTSVIEDYTRDLLAPLPENAILVGTGDHRMFGVHYQQLTRGFRPDVVYVDASLLAYGWYESRVEARTSVELTSSSPTEIPITRQLAELVTSGRPVFLTHLFAEEIEKFPTYPYGVTLAVVGPKTRPPPPRELASANSKIFEQFRLNASIHSVESAWELEVYEHYERTWRSLANALERAGDHEGAAHARTFATLFSPR